jgi:phosphoribosylglycinamide formyltransferase-1
MIRLGFLASNNGSGMRAVVSAIEAGKLDAQARIVVSNRPLAPALAFAEAHGLASLCIPTAADPAGADACLAEALGRAEVDWVILSGYLRKLGPITLGAFQGRILNIHPALLPKFGGKGMYGRRVHEAVRASGDAVSGATVHLVDAEYDHGPTVAQARVAIDPADTAEDIERKVTAVEPGLLLGAVRAIVEGRLAVDPTMTPV